MQIIWYFRLYCSSSSFCSYGSYCSNCSF